MSILIKGIDMPKAGGILLFIDASGKATEGILQEIAPTISGFEREYDVIEVPPHGRLIDADVFEKENDYFWNRDFINPRYDDTLSDLVNAAPTIIEAEE